MKTFVRHAVTLLAITVACQAGLALAEDYYQLAGSDQTATPVGNEKAVTPGQSVCSSCGQTGCGCSCGCDSCCCRLGCDDDCSRFGIVGFAGLDAFNGISDATGPSNFGTVTGFNAGAPLLGLGDYGIGWQVGVSYGIYDFDGRSPVIAGESAAGAQQQTFVTTGFFRKAHGDQRWSFGVVYDWMYNTNWGVFGVDPTLGQWRAQIEYSLSGCNSVGLWGAKRDLCSVQELSRVLGVESRVISQLNFFWHHKFTESCADSWLWVGIPDHGRLDTSESGSLGDWTIGASVQVPLSSRVALYANGSYMHPSAAAGITAANETFWDVSMGVAWYFGGNARSHAINGKCWTPLLPVANNSTFLVDERPLLLGP
jgi:hypothetical protein